MILFINNFLQAFCDCRRKVTKQHNFECCKFNVDKQNEITDVLSEGMIF